MSRRLAGAFALALFGYACYWSIRLAYADHLAADRTPANMEHAIRLAPGNPEYYVRLAEAGPASALPAMEKAAALNPLNSSVWIEFARIAEEQNALQRAEQCLLRAVQVDKTFAPRWLLAEYYFRRRDEPHFWPAMRSALATSYDDVTPLFDECWTIGSQPETILQRAIPTHAGVLRQYLDYVVAKDRLDLAAAVFPRVMEGADSGAVPPMLSYCDRLLDHNQVSQALEVWNSLATKRLLDYPALAPEKGASLTNGGFERPFLSKAFDWRLADTPGISNRRGGRTAGLRLSFSGKQPETCEILSEFVPLAPARKYRFSARYDANRIARETGLSWRVLEVSSGTDLLRGAGQLTGKEESNDQEIVFATPPQTRLARLVLTYRRVLGTVRIEGDVWLRSIRLGFAE